MEGKIAFFVNTMSAGGAEAFVQSFSDYLYDKNIDFEIIVVKNIVIRETKKKPIVLFDLKKKPFYMPSFFYEKNVIKKFKETIDKIKPKAIISNLFDCNIRGCILKKEKGLDSKLILVEHVPKEVYNDKQIKLIKKFYNYADLVVAVSEKVRQDLEFYGIEKNKIVVIENGIDINQINEKAKKEIINFDKFTLISAGRLSDDKGFDTLIKAFSLVNKKIQNSQLIILGEGSKRKDLERLISKLNLTEKVKLAGLKENPFPYIKSANIYITSSRRESFSFSTLEAMALAKPVVTTDVVPFAKDKYNALIVPMNNENKMADAILNLVNDKNLMKYLSENALKTALEYSQEKSFEKYLNLI